MKHHLKYGGILLLAVFFEQTSEIPSLKQTANAPENRGAPGKVDSYWKPIIFRGERLVSGRVTNKTLLEKFYLLPLLHLKLSPYAVNQSWESKEPNPPMQPTPRK